MPLPTVSRATISALHDLVLLVVAVPQVPTPLSKSAGLREANRVTPVSIHSVTPDLSLSEPLRKPDSPALPFTSRTAWPAGQLSMAVWMRLASGWELLGLPSTVSMEPLTGVIVAASVLQTAESAGRLGSATLPRRR